MLLKAECVFGSWENQGEISLLIPVGRTLPLAGKPEQDVQTEGVGKKELVEREIRIRTRACHVYAQDPLCVCAAFLCVLDALLLPLTGGTCVLAVGVLASWPLNQPEA